MMIVRLSVAICGVAITFASAPDVAQTTVPAAKQDVPLAAAEQQFTIAANRPRLTPMSTNVVAKSEAIEGVASTYNPYRPGYRSGGKETASGEPYDENTWTAAIQIDLREKFGGVRFGKEYQPSYALVESFDKKVVVKINDVGPLKPGRVIDFNEQTMRYFDPSLQLGLIPGVKITPLLGDDWPTGPVEDDT